MSDINSRIKELIDTLEMNPTSFSKAIGLSNNMTITNIVGGRLSKPSYSILESIIQSFDDLNIEWLMTGKGNIFKTMGNSHDNNAQIETFNLRTDKVINEQSVPLYDIHAVAGLVPLFNDTSAQNPINYLNVPNVGKCDGAIYVTGDSMYPLLKSGDIILYKKISVTDIEYNIFWGEMYLLSVEVDDEEYITIKYIQKSEKEGYVKLVSQNSHHAPKDILMSSIKALAFVKASIRFNAMK